MHPSTLFIVPYRDRAEHGRVLRRVLETNLVDWIPGSYRVVFVHQDDARPFNRGAMKNIGAIWARSEYRDAYDDMTLVFHDVDTWPLPGSRVTYTASPGSVSHFYGFDFSLGGIVGIKGSDFDRTGGFPNFWGWGLEDNSFLDRCIKAGLSIDRSSFHGPGDPLVERAAETPVRTIAIGEAERYRDGKLDGVADVTDLHWERVGDMLNVRAFSAGTSHLDYAYRGHDVRSGPRIPVHRRAARRKWDMGFARR